MATNSLIVITSWWKSQLLTFFPFSMSKSWISLQFEINVFSFFDCKHVMALTTEPLLHKNSVTVDKARKLSCCIPVYFLWRPFSFLSKIRMLRNRTRVKIWRTAYELEIGKYIGTVVIIESRIIEAFWNCLIRSDIVVLTCSPREKPYLVGFRMLRAKK